MILLDTHAWIWWVAEPDKLSPKAIGAIRAAENEKEVCVATISCWEIAMLVAKERIGFTMDVEEWLEKSLRLPEMRLLELTPRIAVLSTRLTGNPPSDPADRILIATSKVHHCPIVSRDQAIRDYAHVESVW